MTRIGQTVEVKAKETLVNPHALVHWIAFALFLTAFLPACVAALFPVQVHVENSWLQISLLLAATTTSLISLSHQLPWQNVLLAAGIIAVIGAGAQGIGALTGFPFEPSLWGGAADRYSRGILWQFAPLIWIITILNSRGVAKLILLPQRDRHDYGFWVFGLTLTLAFIFKLALESSFLQSSVSASHWREVTAIRLAAWSAAAMLALILATPSLINKKPAAFASDFHPLVVWTFFNFLFASLAALHHRWLAMGMDALAMALTVVFAVRGGWRICPER